VKNVGRSPGSASHPTPPALARAAGTYEGVYQLVQRAVRKSCPSWLSAERDDLVQCAMQRIHAVLGRRAEGDQPLGMSYVQRVAFTVTLDEIRRAAARKETSMDTPGTPQEFAAPRPSPEAQAEGAEIGEAVRDCLSQLVDARRRAATLHLLGHSVPDVARLLGWNDKQAENAVYRGFADLRECLTSKGFEP
jgi:RNA polymerase sigma-70 factor, ECF subfamily